MIRVKLSLPGFANADISQFTGNTDSSWDGIKFFVNDPTIDRADHWIVIDDLNTMQDEVLLKNENCTFLNGEVVYSAGYYDRLDRKAFISQFSRIYSHLDIYANNVTSDIPFLPWMINANHGASIFSPHFRDVDWFRENHEIEKTRTLSVICSAQTPTEQHVLRLKFVTALKEHFKDRLDWFGNGISPTAQKWDALAPYKYSIVLENQARYNIITEKPGDAYLSLTYPLYYGASNIDEVFGEGTSTALNIYDLKGAIAAIEATIESNAWERSLPLLREARLRVLDDLNLFKRIARIVHEIEAQSNGETWEKRRLASVGQTRSKLRRAKPLPYLVHALGLRLAQRGERISSTAARRF